MCSVKKESGSQNAADNGGIEGLGRLLGELVHEIKNPLSTVKVNLKLVDEELGGFGFSGSDKAVLADCEQRLGRARRKIGVIAKETERLEQILGGFLRYADRTAPQFAEVKVNELVGDMIDFYAPQARSHSITVRHHLHKEPLVCRADAHMLKQAILNLLINAQQAMSCGGELMIRTSREGGWAQIQVCDTGSGVAEDNVGRIFEVYYSSRSGGTGLGLPTAKRMIESNKGQISVASEEGKGSCFTIRLPLSASGAE